MRVGKFFNKIDVPMANKVIIYNSKSENPIFKGNFYNFWAAVVGDTQYEVDLINDRVYDDLDEYHKCLEYADAKLYKGLENGTSCVRFEPITAKNGVAILDIIVCIK